METPKIYEEQFKKINFLSLCMHALTVILILSVIFLPVYKSKSTSIDAANYESLEEWGEALEEYLEKGYVETSFSLFDECMLFYRQLITDGESAVSNEGEMICWYMFELPATAIFILIFFALLYNAVKHLVGTLMGLINSDESWLLTYPLIKKSGATGTGCSWMSTQGGVGAVIGGVLYAILGIGMRLLLGPIMLRDMLESIEQDYKPVEYLRNVMHLSGISVLGYIVLALGVVSLVLEWMIKEKKKKLRLAIIKEDLQQGQEQQAQVTEQTQA